MRRNSLPNGPSVTDMPTPTTIHTDDFNISYSSLTEKETQKQDLNKETTTKHCRLSSELFNGSDVSDISDLRNIWSSDDELRKKSRVQSSLSQYVHSADMEIEKNSEDNIPAKKVKARSRRKMNESGQPEDSESSSSEEETEEKQKQVKVAAKKFSSEPPETPKSKEAGKTEEETVKKLAKKEQVPTTQEGVPLGKRKRILPYAMVNVPDRSGRTPIYKFASSGDYDSCLALVQAGADLNIRDHAGWTPLHEACLEGHAQITELLVVNGANVNSTGGDSDTPLHDAVYNGHVKVAEILLAYGASLEALNENEETPIDVAENDEMRELLTTWKTRRSEIMATTPDGRTVIHDAAANGNVEKIQFYLKYGADVNTKDHAGWTPLHEAAEKGHFAVVELLLDHGADVNSVGPNGCGPLLNAVRSQVLSCIELMLKFGANPSHVDQESGKSIAELCLNEAIQSLLSQNWQPFRQCKIVPHIIQASSTISTAVEKAESDVSEKRRLVETNIDAASSHPNDDKFPSTREERKFQALLRTISALDSEQGDELEKKRKRIDLFVPVVSPMPPVKKKRGRPRKNPEINRDRSESIDPLGETLKSEDVDFDIMSVEDPTPVKKQKRINMKPGSAKKKKQSLSDDMDIDDDPRENVKQEEEYLSDVGHIAPSSDLTPLPSEATPHISEMTPVPSPTYGSPKQKALLVLKKKAKKRNWLLDVSGYHDSQSKESLLTTTEESIMAESTMTNIQDMDINCLPLFSIRLPSRKNDERAPLDRYLVDLQVARCIGLESGRALLEKYPTLSRRLASFYEKQQLQKTPLSVKLYEHLKHTEPRMMSYIRTLMCMDGQKGLRLTDVDIHFVRERDVMRIIKDNVSDEVEVIELDVQWWKSRDSMEEEDEDMSDHDPYHHKVWKGIIQHMRGR